MNRRGVGPRLPRTSYFLVGLLCIASFLGCMVTSRKIADGDGKVTLSWDDVIDASSYNIYYRDSAGVTKQNGEKIADAWHPFTFSGLQRGKTYHVVVTAVARYGESRESEEISFLVE